MLHAVLLHLATSIDQTPAVRDAARAIMAVPERHHVELLDYVWPYVNVDDLLGLGLWQSGHGRWADRLC